MKYARCEHGYPQDAFGNCPTCNHDVPSNTASASIEPEALGPVEVVVNDQRYVREETLFAAMRDAAALRAIVDSLIDWSNLRDKVRLREDPSEYAWGEILLRRYDALTYTPHSTATRPDGEGEPPEATRGLGEEAGRTDGEGLVEA